MKTLDEYSQSESFEEKMQDIEYIIEDLDIPKTLKSNIKLLIEENKFEIAEHNYTMLKSDYQDYCYERQKEDKYFKEGD